MNEAFLKAYERELSLLYDRGKEFAQDYPGIASRLGGVIQGNMDPAVDGLLQGTAFLAARVQVQMDREFSTFTHELLDQLLPNILAPIPSAMLVQATRRDVGAEGQHFPSGSNLDARYVEREKRIQCRYRLCGPMDVWPIKVADADYFSGAGRFQALGLEPHPDTNGGLKLTVKRLAKDAPMSELPMTSLDVHLTGEMSDAAGLYEAIFAQNVRATIRIEDKNGDAIIVPLTPDQIEPIGLSEEEALFPDDTRVFHGFVLLREFFMFPRKFLGFRLKNLEQIIQATDKDTFEVLFELRTVSSDLVPRIDVDDFSLFCAPAINLFEESASQIRLDDRDAEHHVIPSSNPADNYEIHRIQSVSAIFTDGSEKVPVYPLYGAPPDAVDLQNALYFTYRQRDRRLSSSERRAGRKREYRGTETLLSLYEPTGLDDTSRPARLIVRTMSSNRHLPLHLPIGQGGADFYMSEDTSMSLTCVAGPTPPKSSIMTGRADARDEGKIPWQLVSFLSLNFLGLDNRTPGGGVRGLRELLSIFVDLESPVNAQQIEGIESLKSRSIVRSIKRGNRYHSARGIEITLTFDERSFESTSILLFSAVLERFFGEYAPVNSFTQTVVVSKQRGKLKTWPPRSGQGPIL